MKPIFHAAPEPASSNSQAVAAALELPQKALSSPRLLIGRKEWIALPDLGVWPINAKTDSGALSSSIHAQRVVISEDKLSVDFTTTNHAGEVIACQAKIARIGRVRSSSGKARKRVFIETTAVIAGGFQWPIVLSLANRSEMRCPMLLGRRALAGYFLIDPQRSYLLGTRKNLRQSL